MPRPGRYVRTRTPPLVKRRHEQLRHHTLICRIVANAHIRSRDLEIKPSCATAQQERPRKHKRLDGVSVTTRRTCCNSSPSVRANILARDSIDGTRDASNRCVSQLMPLRLKLANVRRNPGSITRFAPCITRHATPASAVRLAALMANAASMAWRCATHRTCARSGVFGFDINSGQVRETSARASVVSVAHTHKTQPVGGYDSPPHLFSLTVGL